MLGAEDDEDVAQDLSFQEDDLESEEEDLADVLHRAEELAGLVPEDLLAAKDRAAERPGRPDETGQAGLPASSSGVAALPQRLEPEEGEGEQEERPEAAIEEVVPQLDVPVPAGRGRAAKAVPKRGQLLAAAASVQTPGGRIAFYAGGNFFQATCGRHPQCALTRTANGTFSRNGVSGGRPLGFLAKWLSESRNAATKEQHWDKEAWRAYTQESRAAERRALADLPGGAELLGCERVVEPGEPEEPVLLKGYVR